jgi:hypothetical protein
MKPGALKLCGSHQFNMCTAPPTAGEDSGISVVMKRRSLWPLKNISLSLGLVQFNVSSHGLGTSSSRMVKSTFSWQSLKG